MSNLRVLDPAFSDPFDSAFRRFFAPMHPDDNQPLRMRIDVNENDQAYQVKADLPGVRKEDIHVRVDGNVVRIDAECKSEKETRGEGDKVLRSERYYGSLSRSFSLANDIDDSKVEAKYADGVLSLQLPKKAPAAARKITVT
ncbi:Hsp20/alpha crystallin family protein [Ramlibacter sp.]|uniref:Hsp20/alpha crystallin family protein n=1 Tax=Ramlibacter sp. TaxID=1917967 RepID=UPI002D5A9E2C|nr:Hsp20/alpha crystallin family protein [Ramlibacter sp.]HYD75197.1 Hsp20/alpha crystallin family protein [Ramlibacter sp.]